MTHTQLKATVESYIEREKQCGHIDAHIKHVHNKSIGVHAGPRDDWNPCGVNFRITPKLVQEDLERGSGVFYDAALEAGIVD